MDMDIAQAGKDKWVFSEGSKGMDIIDVILDEARRHCSTWDNIRTEGHGSDIHNNIYYLY